MQINLSLSQLFFEAFGYASPAFNPKFKDVTGDVALKRKETGKHGSAYYAKDVLGKEIYLPIDIQVGHDYILGTKTRYAEKFGIKEQDGSYSGRWSLPYPVLSAIEIKPHIIDTELTERDGMVSELINISGYSINVRGMLVNKNNEFPEDDFDILTRLVGLKTPIQIRNVVTDILLTPTNPECVVSIRSLRFPETKSKHVRGYELNMMSEIPFSLIDIS